MDIDATILFNTVLLSNTGIKIREYRLSSAIFN